MASWRSCQRSPPRLSSAANSLAANILNYLASMLPGKEAKFRGGIRSFKVLIWRRRREAVLQVNALDVNMQLF